MGALGSLTLLLEALATEDGSTALFDGPGLEGHLARCSALRADSIMHLAGLRVALRLASVATRLAALGGAEAPPCVELLLALREGERRVAVTALDLLIRHGKREKEVKD